MGTRGPQPKKQTPTAWSCDLAYAVGLIATDGCLSKDGRHIDFTSKDLQLIRLFQKCLGIQHIKIGSKTSGSSTRQYARIQFGDVNFYQWLQQIGLTPNKSKTLAALKIPDEFFFDFLRGCFDGDGTISAYWDKRWKKSFMFYVAFASASELFTKWLQNKMSEALAIRGHISYNQKSIYQLRYAKEESLKVCEAMFYAEDVPHLERKRIKMRKIFRRHNKTVKQNKYARVL